MPITPKDFVERWSQSSLRETQAAQSHFNELCELVGHKTPAQMDPAGEFFTFEEHVVKATGGNGRADVWYKDRFAWEYKGKHKDLDDAYAQLSSYRGGLGNPPLLVVCDFLEYRIYPQWPNMSGQPFVFHNADLLRPDTLRYITWLLESPDQFRELRQSELERREKITFQLADRFAHLADLMRQHSDTEGRPMWESMQIARFLTKITFVLFAQDIGLLPTIEGKALLNYTIDAGRRISSEFSFVLRLLFEAMEGDRPGFFGQLVPYFNGGLFADSQPDSGDGLEVLDVTEIPSALDLLQEASDADWRYVNPTIFGTLFEGALDASKRAQLGAHYTSEADIRLIVEPVLMQPLYRLWDEIQSQAQPLMQVFLNPDTPPRPHHEAMQTLQTLYQQMMDKLEHTRVLDPACGSGNFLYVSLRMLKDLEGQVRKFFEPLGLPFRDVVTPRQMYGIEKDIFAARLAQVVCWIGYLQWRYEDEGLLHPHLMKTSRPHPRELPNPILMDKLSPDEPDRILCADAIMRYDADGTPYEPDWPEVDVIMGNPPFLGGKRMRTELGGYVDNLFTLYEERVPHEADLVCYWYEKARSHIERGKARRAGLLATNSIRQGVNREVLERIKQTGDIFIAWGDRPWVLEGAAIRISMIGFDDGTQKNYLLDGAPVTQINSDLQNTIDATKARRLPENIRISFMADTKGGSFDISGDVARRMLAAVNKSGRSNSDVVRPWVNGFDITGRPRDMWIIDFGTNMPLEEAQLYELPFAYVREHVYPERQENRRESYRLRWWIHVEPRPTMRQQLAGLDRYIATVIVAKHRLFVWLSGNVLPDHRLYVFTRADDYFFGVLHSCFHELWSLRLGSTLEDRPSYVGEACFETFPFPWPPGKEDTSHPAYKAISEAAKQLHEERELWLNPPELTGDNAGVGASESLKKRTLTNLYNALEAYRQRILPSLRSGEGPGVGIANGGNNGPRKTPSPADSFAPRLHELHTALDKAVCDAYGWPHEILGDEEEILRRLLALNLERANTAGQMS